MGAEVAQETVDPSKVGRTQPVLLVAADDPERTQPVLLVAADDPERTQPVRSVAADDPERTQPVRAAVAASDRAGQRLVPRPRRPVDDESDRTALLPKQAYTKDTRLAVARVPGPMERTTVLKPVQVAAPVFVDDSGRRRRLLVAAALVVALSCVALLGLLWLSQLGSGAHLNLGSGAHPNAGWNSDGTHSATAWSVGVGSALLVGGR